MTQKLHLNNIFRSHAQADKDLGGKFIDHDAYDILITEDTDVYKKSGLFEEESESNLLLKFRKKVIPQDKVRAAYEGLRHGAGLTDNRGLAAGTGKEEYQQLITATGSESGRRRWVTERESICLSYMMKGSPKDVLREDQLETLWNNGSTSPIPGRGGGGLIGGGSIWIVEKVKNFDIQDWFESTFEMDAEERYAAASLLINDKVSSTTYGNGVYSGTAGYMDRYPRIPFCRETAWTAGNKEKFESGIPMMEECSRVFQREVPLRWQGQKDCIDQLSEDWRIGNTVYTTITLNRDFRTACHRDAGDLCEQPEDVMERKDGHAIPRGFSNLTAMTNGKKYEGFYLCFPEFRAAVDIRDGDLLMMDAHQIHANTPLISGEEGIERCSVVLYFRKAMLKCESLKNENMRRDFVYDRKARLAGKDGRPKNYNGIDSDIFFSKDWEDWLKRSTI
jgi:hypothetical protein